MPPAAVPETALKKRTRDEAWATTRAEGAAKARAARSAARKDAFKRAESYVKEYRAQVNQEACGRVGAIPWLSLGEVPRDGSVGRTERARGAEKTRERGSRRPGAGGLAAATGAAGLECGGTARWRGQSLAAPSE